MNDPSQLAFFTNIKDKYILSWKYAVTSVPVSYDTFYTSLPTTIEYLHGGRDKMSGLQQTSRLGGSQFDLNGENEAKN